METPSEWLRRAIDCANVILAHDVSLEEAECALDARARFISRATEAATEAGGFDPEAARLASALVAQNAELLRALWRPRADAFRWLRERAPEKAALLGELSLLSDALD